MPKHSRPALTLEEVRHVAKLARLRLNEAQLEQYRGQLSAILDHIEKLNELDVTGVEPMAHPTGIANRMEEDDVSPPMPLDDLLKNAPAVEGRFLAVLKVLADES